jgi:hypothetical protein
VVLWSDGSLVMLVSWWRRRKKVVRATAGHVAHFMLVVVGQGSVHDDPCPPAHRDLLSGILGGIQRVGALCFW